MKALTLTQPWASLVALGEKRIETRSWGTSYRGPLAIHAAKGWLRPDRDLALEWKHLLGPRQPLPLGAIVAIADLVRVEVVTDALRDEYVTEQEDMFGDFHPGRVAWFLEDVSALSLPISCRGALGLWTVPPDVMAALTRAWGDDFEALGRCTP